MPAIEQLKRFPSFCTGSVRQTLATLRRVHVFENPQSRSLVLIPGAFCTGSVMNRLGMEMQRRGHSISIPPSFAYYVSALANICRLSTAARAFLRWLERLGEQRHITEVDVAGHSNGGLIALLAQDMIDQGEASCPVAIRKVVTMAAPLGGLPAARALALLLPCCRDIGSASTALRRAKRAHRLLAACLVAGGDFLVPPLHQFQPDVPRTVMNGFQHMDFIVGTPARVVQTADEVDRWLTTS